MLIQAVEAGVPESTEVFGELGDTLERRRFETAGTPLRLAPSRYQTGALEHPEVLRDGRSAHREWR